MKMLTSLALVLILILAGCQTAAKPAAAAPEKAKETVTTPEPAPSPAPVAEKPPVADSSSIVAGDTGFSPLAQPPHNYLSFSLHFARPDAIKGWLVEFSNHNGAIVRTVRGDASRLPPTLTWDGNGDKGKLAAEGEYKARLTANYGAGGDPVPVESSSFLLDITPPSGTITVTPQPFEPGDPDIMVNPPQVELDVNLVRGAAPVSSWRLLVVHPNGTTFMDFISEQHKDNKVLWNGRASNNAALQRGTTYAVTAQVFDRYGNVGNLTGSLAVAKAAPVSMPVVRPKPEAQAAPVTVSIDGKLVESTKIFFPAYSADLSKVSQAKKEANNAALDELAEALKKATEAKIKVVGHANKVFWRDEARGSVEQEQVLIPLSMSRAQAVRDALAQRGLKPEQFDLTGVGADGPLAPFGDLVNNWKNRRVEFVLEQTTVR